MNEPLKVLHISHLYHPSVGGVEEHVRQISERLAAMGDRVTVFTSTGQSARSFVGREGFYSPGKEVISGVKVVRFPVVSFHARFIRPLMVTAWKHNLPFNDRLRTLYNGPVLRGIGQAIAAGDWDIIMAMPMPFMTILYGLHGSRKKGVPYAIIPCLHLEDKFQHQRESLLRALRQADAIIASSPSERQFLEQAGIPGEKIHVVGCGADPAEFEKPTSVRVRRRYGIGDYDPVILTVGQMVSHKGIDTLIRAMPRVWGEFPSARLIVAGRSTTYTRHLEKMAESVDRGKRRVILIADFTESEKPDLYHTADIFALPSLYESFGIVFPEAWICGKPVIGARIGAITSIVEDGRDGLLVNYGDPEELAGRIIYLLKNPETRRKMGEWGRAKVLEKHTWAKVAGKIRDIYRGLVTGRRDGDSTAVHETGPEAM